MAEHERAPLTAGRPAGRSGGRRRGGRGRRRTEQAVQLMYAAGWLLSSPGAQQLMVWGGPQAQDLVGRTAALAVERHRLTAAADAWHTAAGDLRHLTGGLESGAGGVAGWESEAAEAFRAAHRARLDRLTALAGTYRAVGDTLAGAADQAGRVHGALLAATHTAGESVRLLGDGLAAGGAAQAVLGAWAAGARSLLAGWAAHADQAAATLAALHATTAGATPRAHLAAG